MLRTRATPRAIGLLKRLLTVLVTCTLLVSCSPPLSFGPWATASVRVGPVHRVTQASYAYEPDIAVDPRTPAIW